jgi:2-desacetyl-2-hydroxyethyl bacteriochlorophyllide A dehydrogenase
MRTLALEFTGPKRIEITETEIEPTADRPVVVRTCFSGISAGTEMLAYRGQIDPGVPLDEILDMGGTFSYPFRYGYSCVGVVERGAGDLAEGDLVFAYHPHQQHLTAAPDALIPLHDMDPRVATMLPVIETALQLSVDAEVLPGDAVCVFGLGAVGLATGLVLLRAGAHVTGVEPSPVRRKIGADLGLVTVEPGQSEAAIADATGGRGVSRVIEVSGRPEALTQGLQTLAHEGLLVAGSWYGDKSLSVHLGTHFHRRRLTIRSSQVSTIPRRLQDRWSIPQRRAVALSLLKELPVDRLATHTFPFEDAPDIYQAVERGVEDVIHVALRYP